MKFKLSIAGYFYNSEEEVNKLKELGFKFISGKEYEEKYGHGWLCDYKYALDDMTDDKVIIEIDTLEELLDFIKEYGQIILDKDSITIYDDYLE